MKYIDLTHTFKKTMPVFPGDTEAKLEQVAFFEKNSYNSFHVQTGMHVGTHMDAPFHMLAEGKKLSEFNPDKFIGRGKIIDTGVSKDIDVNLLKNHDIQNGDIVLVHTGHDQKFGTEEYYKSYPEISMAFAEYLVNAGIKILGLDFPSPDGFPYHIHKLLFKNDILIIENLTNLSELLPYSNFNIIALPAKFEAAGAPVRVIAQIL
ncbi:MAG: cyclase family protein [Bacteroidetes bacterium]|nr:MAG: cyclase family protein [Bacteroidota bacterium]